MTCRINIDLTDVSGYAPALGDTVTFEAKNLIGAGSTPGRVITTAPAVVNLETGVGSIDLEPGPVIIRIKARNYRGGNKIEATVPDDTEALTLRELLENSFVYEPSTVQEAQLYKNQARQAAADAEAALQSALGIYGDAQAIAQAVADTDEDRTQAQAAQSAAEKAQRKAETAQTAAESAQTAAETAQGQAESSSSSASNSATLADEHRSAAESAKTAAETAQTAAETARTDALKAQSFAEAAQTDARAAADDAQDAQGNAESAAAAANGSAADARSAASTAVQDATTAMQGMRDAAAASSEAAASSKAAAATSAEDARRAAESAVEVVGSGVPDATKDIKGAVKLSGDLSGTADAPQVPGLCLTAPGANLRLSPPGEGWSYATNDPAAHGDWTFDGVWLKPPDHVMTGIVRVDWCGASSADLRGRRKSDGTVVTIGTVPAGTPEDHRHIMVDVDFMVHESLSVAGTWIPGDLEAECDIALTVLPDQTMAMTIDQVTGLTSSLAGKRDVIADSYYVYSTGSGGVQTMTPYSSGATASSIALRDANGRLAVSTPTSSNHAATKSYTDSIGTSAKSYADAKFQTVTSLPSTPDSGTIYFVVSA